MAETANIVWADGPPNEPYQPEKSRIRAWGTWLESFLSAIGINSGSVFTSRSSLYSNLSPGANSMAWVLGDPVASYNGIYQKQGASWIGSWVRIGDLPFSFIVASDIGAGTPNAIQATSSIPVSASALVVANIFEANTNSPVTISFNGGPILTIKTNTGNDIVPGGLVAGMQIFGFVSGSTFRLINDQVSSAIVAAAEAAADEASAYADFIRNNWIAAGPFTGTGVAADYLLPINPGSVNNMFPIVGGVVQMVSEGAYSLTTSGGNFYININVPIGVQFEVRIGNKVDIGTPSDGTVTAAKLAAGSVTTTKIPDDAVTYAKMQNVSATARLLGRVTAGAGDAEELTAAQLRDSFLPAGSIVDSAYSTISGAFGITALIPVDNTIPQISEGTQVMTLNITPKKTTNKLRATIVVTGSLSGVGAWVTSLFSAGGANALAAEISNIKAAGDTVTATIIHEWTPGVTTTIAVAVRCGVATPYSGQTLTMAPAFFGGVNHGTLLLQEIAG